MDDPTEPVSRLELQKKDLWDAFTQVQTLFFTKKKTEKREFLVEEAMRQSEINDLDRDIRGLKQELTPANQKKKKKNNQKKKKKK